MSTPVFLPGMVEIVTLHDILCGIVRENDVSSIDIFVLHFQIPLEEQGKAFVVPASDKMHVILATNLAESSVTIPNLVLVINTALQQYNHFDSVQQMCVLRKTSKAGCSQRAGRAGRQFQGLYSMLPEPEIFTASLDKLYLSARSIRPQFLGEISFTIFTACSNTSYADQVE